MWFLTAAAALVITMLGSGMTPVRAATSPANGSSTDTLFVDYFTLSPDPAWTFVNRAGKVAGGRLVIAGDYLPGPRPSRDGWAMTHVGLKTWRDYRFSATYDSSNVGGDPAGVHMANLFFRVVTSGKRGYGTYYRIGIWDPEQPDPTGFTNNLPRGLVVFERYKQGNYSQLKLQYNSATVTGSNQVDVAVKGARVTCAVNGQRIFTMVDPNPIRYGGVGLGAIWETNGSFDNVVVRQLSD